MMSTIELINYTGGDETRQPRRVQRLEAHGAVLLRAARAPAPGGRRPGPVAGPVSRAPPDRAGPADADGAACRDVGVPCVECHRPGEPPGVSRPGAPAPIRGGSSRQGPGPYAHRCATPGADARADDDAALRPQAPF